MIDDFDDLLIPWSCPCADSVLGCVVLAPRLCCAALVLSLFCAAPPAANSAVSFCCACAEVPSVLAPPGQCGRAMWLRPYAPPTALVFAAAQLRVPDGGGFRHPSVQVSLGPPPASVRRAFPRTDGSNCPQLLPSGPCPLVPLVDAGPGGAISAGKPHVCSVAALACGALPQSVADARHCSRPSRPYPSDVTSVHAGLAGWLNGSVSDSS